MQYSTVQYRAVQGGEVWGRNVTSRWSNLPPTAHCPHLVSSSKQQNILIEGRMRVHTDCSQLCRRYREMGAMLPNTPQSNSQERIFMEVCESKCGVWHRSIGRLLGPGTPLVSTVQHQNHNKSGLMFSSPDSEIFGQSSEILSLAHICNIRNHFPKFTMQIFTNEIAGPK